MAISSSQVSIHVPLYLLWSRASGLGLLSRWLATVPQGDGHTTGKKTARNAKLGNVARTISCITPARTEEQIRKSKAMDHWLCATRIVLSDCLGPLFHADMVFSAWPKMAKTADFGRDGPHLRRYISMTMASNHVTKNAIDTWDLGPSTCRIPAPEAAFLKPCQHLHGSCVSVLCYNLKFWGCQWLNATTHGLNFPHMGL